MKPKLDKAGRQLWDAVQAHLELDQQEGLILLEACRITDRLDKLDAIVRRDGVVLASGKPSFALVEARSQALVLARLIASLRLPENLAEPERRPQRRGSSRGIYRIHSGAS